MSASENPSPSELQEQLQGLRILLALMLAMLIVASCFADYFLSRQIHILEGQSQQMVSVIQSFPQVAANDFIKHLQEYSKSHPDFAPVAAKYPGLFNQMPSPLPAAKK